MTTRSIKSKTTSNRTIDTVKIRTTTSNRTKNIDKIRTLSNNFDSFCNVHGDCDLCPVNKYISTLKLPDEQSSCAFIYEHILKDKVENPSNCPFCGSETKIEQYESRIYVECPECGYSSMKSKSLSEAIKLHNKFCNKLS